jgi:hypothetical protein
MNKPTNVEPLPNYQLKVTYSDGVIGIIDLAADVGRGVFKPLADETFFKTVHIGEFGQIAWNETIEICSDASYEEIARGNRVEASHA